MAWIERRRNPRTKEMKYRVGWDVGTPDKRDIKRSEMFDTWDDANNERIRKEAELLTGTYIDANKITMGEYMAHWLAVHETNLAPKTRKSYALEIKNHIIPKIGSIRLQKLSPLHLQEYYSNLLKSGKRDILVKEIADYVARIPEYEKKHGVKSDPARKMKKRLELKKIALETMDKSGDGGLSVASVLYQHRIIHRALSQAVKWQMVARNVDDAVELPKAVKVELQYMQKNDVTAFIKLIGSAPEYPIVATAILTGMRQGEILGLRRQDVDFEHGVIHVRQQLQYISGEGFSYPPPKRHAMRDIPMMLPLRKIIKDSVKAQDGYRNLLGADEYNSKDDLVFCQPDGKPWLGTTITKRFQRLCVDNGYLKIRFHSLRHSFATMARGAGMELSDVQDMLGHADIRTTKNIYTHTEIEPLRSAMQKFTDYMAE